VELAQTYYSVPPEYVGRRVWVWWDLRLVRIFNTRMEQIALHAGQSGPNREAAKSCQGSSTLTPDPCVVTR
jgi:hypothetical protein